MTARQLRRPFCVIVCVCIFALIPNVVAADNLRVPAFPGAEGYGKYATGGRGGKVYEVTNLDASGEGSLRAALEAKGPRIVVFRVSGTIDADLSIKNGFITVAGQTAPGDGIAIRGQLGISANNVIIRYIRVRAEGRGDAISGRYNENVIFDHVSASWSSDEVFTIYHGKNVTVQWCMITEACGGSHKFGGIWGNDYSTYHHNLIAHNIARNPRFASGGGYNDFRNNVIYNWQHESMYGGEKQQPTKASSQHEKNKTKSHFFANVVANYYKPGPGTKPEHKTKICAPWSRNGASDYGKWYFADNYLVGSPEVTADNWKGVFPANKDTLDLDAIEGLKLDQPSVFMPIKQQTAEAAYQAVLDSAGCSLPNRDSLDAQIMEEVRTGTAPRGDNGFIKNPMISGGWPELKSAPAPADSDHDGMPDAWEKKFGLDPQNANDNAQDKDADGYTNVEEYLNDTDPTEFIDYTACSGSELPAMTAHFPLNEGTGSTVTDLVSGATGEFSRAESVVWSSSPKGNVLKMDGIDSRIIVPNCPAVDFSDESFSVSFHVRWKEGSSLHHQHFICKGDYDPIVSGETGKRWEMSIRERGFSFIIDDNTNKSELRVAGDTILKGDWVHVVGIRDRKAKQLKLYFNGKLQKSNDPQNILVNGTDTTGSISNPRELVIGDSSRQDNPVEGDMADVRIFRTALSESQIAGVAKLWTSAKCDVATFLPPMTAHFPLDETTGNVVTEVISGTEGELVNADSTDSWVPGKLGGALHLDGINDRVFVPHHPAFDFADESFTVSFLMCWPKGMMVSSERFFTKGDYSSAEPGQTGKRWELWISNHKHMTFGVDDDVYSSRLKVPIAPFITGEWVHVVAMRDTKDRQLKLYANGVRQQAIDQSEKSGGVDKTGSISNPQRLTIGDAYVLDAPFGGELDDIRIFRCALTDEQIASLAKAY